MLELLIAKLAGETLSGIPAIDSPVELREEAVERILASKHFAKAQLLSAFLSYVCAQSIEPGASRVTEQEIGVRVFHRLPGYDTGVDNIVRNYARQLRRRLQDYYAEEGERDGMRIEIPRGGYVPVFIPKAPPVETQRDAPAALADLEEAAEASCSDALAETDLSPAAMNKRGRLAWAGVSALLVLLCACAGLWLRHTPIFDPNAAILNAIWRQIFVRDKNTFIVPADTGFVMLQEMDKRTYSLSEYETWPGVEQFDHIYTSYLRAQKYTSVLDLRIISQIERRPEAKPERSIIRSARDLKVEDLSEGNAVLLGSIFSNPWVAVVEPQLNFHFVYDPSTNRSWISNLHPRSGEQPVYSTGWSSYSHGTYAVLALVPNLHRTGHILLIQGLDGPGTEAATEMLFSGRALQPILIAARRSDGSLRGFEVLLRATSLESHATETSIIAYRILD